jgi:RsiW-degrading membrane proteinase PrsW (M82 family)
VSLFYWKINQQPEDSSDPHAIWTLVDTQYLQCSYVIMKIIMNNYVKYYLTKLVLPTIYNCRGHTNKTISYNIYCKNYGGRTEKT